VTGLYVHVPFCVSKCPYCDFFSVTDRDRVPVYLQDLSRELELYADSLGQIDTLYIGGGTPSSLNEEQLTGLLATVCQKLTARKLEFTVEANPADIHPGLLTVLQKAGVNRLSLGVQSFDDGELRLLGRRHDRAQAIRAIELIRENDFADLGLDLIYGLPGSDPAGLGRNLQTALDFRPEHLSCYSLTVAPGTPFYELRRSGQLRLPDDDRSADLFLQLSDVLQAAGYEHYEVSNFARSPNLRSRHNQKYWRRLPTLGLGPGAHSFDGSRRWWNLRDLDAYHRALASGRKPAEGTEELGPEATRLEIIALGLRTSDGVPPGVIGDRPGAQETVARLLDQGLLTERFGRLCPTRRGLLLADGIAKLL
jgi:oxygen-independent coproporphyrinogen-3 oxidase